MYADTSKKPVTNQFSLKALVSNKLHGKKAIPVKNQLRTSNEPAELSELEVFRRYSHKEPPMIAHGMPDYDAFCAGYTARSCEHCPRYINTGTGLFCQMWEDVYPGAVTWYPAD
ncbi:hypothetical protein [Mailhella sp.]|uniref:hypothetical protein n=1 Tax=Mailhella sp. TaxID=1981029 RepID=UPI004062AE82